MTRFISILAVLAACADQPYTDNDACTAAANALATCGHALEQSPFGTCQAAERDEAQQLLDVYASGGCAALTDAKADSWTCSALPFLCVDHTASELAPFTTDGCTMFPDGTLADATRWQHCCITHDFAYFAGGPESARQAADRALQSCIASESNAALADLVYAGVRLGGTPALPTPWRWGYGWTYDPLNGYRTVPADQASAAAAAIAAYRAHPIPPHALEQRVYELAADIATVPGLQQLIEQVNAAVRNLE
jgi:hypothetical protein